MLKAGPLWPAQLHGEIHCDDTHRILYGVSYREGWCVYRQPSPCTIHTVYSMARLTGSGVCRSIALQSRLQLDGAPFILEPGVVDAVKVCMFVCVRALICVRALVRVRVCDCVRLCHTITTSMVSVHNHYSVNLARPHYSGTYIVCHTCTKPSSTVDCHIRPARWCLSWAPAVTSL